MEPLFGVIDVVLVAVDVFCWFIVVVTLLNSLLIVIEAAVVVTGDVVVIPVDKVASSDVLALLVEAYVDVEVDDVSLR